MSTGSLLEKLQVDHLNLLLHNSLPKTNSKHTELTLSDFQADQLPLFCEELSLLVENLFCFETVPQDLAVLDEFNEKLATINHKLFLTNQHPTSEAGAEEEEQIDMKDLNIDFVSDKENYLLLDFNSPMNLAKNKVDKITLDGDEKQRLFKDCTNTINNCAKEEDSDSSSPNLENLECTDEILPPRAQFLPQRADSHTGSSLILADEEENEQSFAHQLLKNFE